MHGASAQKLRPSSRAAICGAIIRHFDFCRDIFVVHSLKSATRYGVDQISLTNIFFGDKLCTDRLDST
jgi:hypothetical protein